jgi:hypothetical protein
MAGQIKLARGPGVCIRKRSLTNAMEAITYLTPVIVDEGSGTFKPHGCELETVDNVLHVSYMPFWCGLDNTEGSCCAYPTSYREASGSLSKEFICSVIWWGFICFVSALEGLGRHAIYHGHQQWTESLYGVLQCFSTAGPRASSGPWHQLYWAARGSSGICHFHFLSIFHE